MSCTNCGSNTPCSCSQQVSTAVGRTCVSNCGCGNPNCCGCGVALPATPLPFYACAPVCPESHKQTFVNQQFYYDIAAQNTWNVPDCGETAVLYVPGIKSIAIGAYIWSLEFGYFEVTAFDSSSNQVTVRNNCNEGNAEVGTNVPACSKFTVSDPPADNSETTDSCIAIDFTAPAVGVSIPITLTNLDSIQASDIIQIGDGRYTVVSIDGPDVITIRNDGLGLVAGTAVIARDPAGNYQYCITLVSTCCERILDEFGGDLTPCSDFENEVLNVDVLSTYQAAGVTLSNTDIADTNTALVTFENESTCRAMEGMLTVQFSLAIGYLGTAGTNILTISILQSVDGAPPTTVYTINEGWVGAPGVAVALAKNFVFPNSVDVAFGVTHTFAYTGRVSLSASGDGQAIVSQRQLHVVGAAAAV